jgi:hypothetical protein
MVLGVCHLDIQSGIFDGLLLRIPFSSFQDQLILFSVLVYRESAQ